MKLILIILLIVLIIYFAWAIFIMSFWFATYGLRYQSALVVVSALILSAVALLVFNLWRNGKVRFKIGTIVATLHLLFASSVFYYDFKTIPRALGEATGMLTFFAEPHVALIAGITRSHVLFAILIYILGSIWFFYLPVFIGMIQDKRKKNVFL